MQLRQNHQSVEQPGQNEDSSTGLNSCAHNCHRSEGSKAATDATNRVQQAQQNGPELDIFTVATEELVSNTGAEDP